MGGGRNPKSERGGEVKKPLSSGHHRILHTTPYTLHRTMSAPSTSKANGGNGATGSKAAPSPTLYVKNIEGKIKKPGKLSFHASSHASFLTILSVPPD